MTAGSGAARSVSFTSTCFQAGRPLILGRGSTRRRVAGGIIAAFRRVLSFVIGSIRGATTTAYAMADIAVSRTHISANNFISTVVSNFCGYATFGRARPSDVSPAPIRAIATRASICVQARA